METNIARMCWRPKGMAFPRGTLEGTLGLLAKYWRKIITPIVAASVVTAIGFSLFTVGTRSFGGEGGGVPDGFRRGDQEDDAGGGHGAGMVHAAGGPSAAGGQLLCLPAGVRAGRMHAKYFTSKPARSCVAVKDLPKGVLCEIEAIAAK